MFTPLFHLTPEPDIGLTGNPAQSATPHPLSYNAQLGWWEAVGIPTLPYDDNGNANAYPMARIVARDAQNNILAEAKIVLNVSDELSCNKCHASSSGNVDAQPAAGWVNDPVVSRDVKLNLLRKHDDRHAISGGMLSQLASAGYNYQSSLYQTALAGTPILCAACHASNALGASGVTGVLPLTAAMHSMHAGVQYNGTTLDNATSPTGSCYLCHPGLTTKCQRGAMRNIACYDCHGNLSAVGSGARAGWLDVPNCQMCHNNTQRYTTTFVSPGTWRTATDATFATQANVPMAPYALYRFSKGHGGLYCGGCHGAPHAEFPTIQANDNVYSTALQSYAGKVTECAVCHTAASTNNGGPHGMHDIGQGWVSNHHNYASGGRYTVCAYCHGATYQGSYLSQTNTQRTFSTENGSKSFAAGTAIGCYNCHNGPTGGD